MGSDRGIEPSIVWFRLDLRLTDDPALAAAIQRGGAVVPVFIWAPEEELPCDAVHPVVQFRGRAIAAAASPGGMT
jgi:deoxyribodipyrimidine photolyase